MEEVEKQLTDSNDNDDERLEEDEDQPKQSQQSSNYDVPHGQAIAQKDKIIAKLQAANKKLRDKLEEVVERATKKIK